MGKNTQSRRGIVRALLAGGIVLGVGAAVTLASWNDSEFATGSFAAGAFNLEGSSTDGTTFADHATAGTGAPLSFTLEPANLSPTDSVYAPFAVRLAAATSTGATVAVSSVGAGDNATHLSYRILQTSAFGCTAATTGTELVPAGTALTASPTGTFPLAKGATNDDPGAAQFLCLIVTADQTLVQAKAATVTWQFLATSQP
jgi:predicted ribosomally synthesized peptide with SipW-like signal peptide